MEIEPNNKPRRRGIYILPNLFTISALFAGFYAVVAGMQGAYSNAAIAIFIAMIMDNLDGRVARLTNTQTDFGAQLDSLSDMVSFGIAPALVMYSWILHSLGKLGWLSAFVYAVAVALRLARFNVQLETADKHYFQGLPCPPAAGVIAGFVWTCVSFNINNWSVAIIGSILVILVGLLMVSNVRYHNFKEIDLKNKVSFLAILVLVLVLVLVAIDPPQILFMAFTLFAISGPILTFWQLRKKRKEKKRAGVSSNKTE
ncbi:MAG: CDP-diacylglycerol--serine O-phosphatidyltransferase [Gammaproteobacteria bacterium]|nr:CDP-diacylglycerol--serine O-phosphatidyltransferase [Gammaproteobacteria bacterium]